MPKTRRMAKIKQASQRKTYHIDLFIADCATVGHFFGSNMVVKTLNGPHNTAKNANHRLRDIWGSLDALRALFTFWERLQRAKISQAHVQPWCLLRLG